MILFPKKSAWLGFTRGQAFVIVACLLLCSTLFGLSLWFRKQEPNCSGNFELAVIGAEVIDGLGGKSFKADIGIRNQQIACIGSIDPVSAQTVIDGEGLAVAPGFIDVHTHVERNIPSNAPFLAANFLRQGVTSIITGNCGRSFPEVRKLFSLLELNHAQINVGTLVGHNTIRLQVMHEGAAAPTQQQLTRMKALVRSAMGDGALGLSTGLEYIPGTFSKTDEIVELARAARETGGLYVSHLRDEGPQAETAIREAISVGERAEIQVHISHFKVQGPNQWGSASQRLDLLRLAKARGIRISADQYPYTASSTGLVVLLPSWLSEGGLNLAKQKLRDPATHKRVRDEMLGQIRALGWEDYSFAKVAYCESDHALVGLTIPEIAQQRGRTNSRHFQGPHWQAGYEVILAGRILPGESELEREADTIIDLYSHGGAQMVFFNMNEDDVQTIMKNPELMFGSDSGVREESSAALPHPRGAGTFPRILGLYAREKHLFSIEEAVRRMTSLPALTFGLKDRGQIKPGYWADLVLFDRKRIRDTATYEEPLSIPDGVEYVIVNGSVTLDMGRVTNSLSGKVIRRDIIGQ